MTTTPLSSDPAGDALLLALTDAIRSATTADIQAAQALLLRRLATEGDVFPSAIQLPQNVSVFGGLVNLLGTLGLEEMRTEMLGSTLGLASSPYVDAGGLALPPMQFTSLANDRPAGAAGAAVPVTVAVRSDLAAGLQAAQALVHGAGGILPLWAPPTALPPSTTTVADPLPYLGREVLLAPTAALADPATDPVVLGRATTDAQPGYRVGIRVSAGDPDAPVLDWFGLVFDAVSGSYVERDLTTVGLLPIETALAGTPWVAGHVAAAPVGRGDLGWARITAVAGLVPGVTTLGDELALLWSAPAIAGSAFGPRVAQTWDGTRFV